MHTKEWRGRQMTEKNEKMRACVRLVEITAVNCLHSQPHDDDECEHHLLKHLARIAEYVGDYRGLAEVEAYDIDWDRDGKKVKLRKSVKLMMDPSEDISETIADRLSDRTGWCVKSCSWRML